jgi:D-alanyl-D-alanine carboxypeptidase/D-alanyl-D-alanine-endopeptidase (penicillin-binding protein 4)
MHVALALLLLGPISSVAQTTQLAAAVEQALQPSRDKGVTAAAVLIDLPTGKTLVATANADAALIPASNQKLLTSAVSIDRFGPDHELTTTLAVAGSDLLVIGGGDPAFGDPALAKQRGETVTAVFDDWAQKLADAGLTHFRGDLVVVDPVFDDPLLHPTWSDYNRLQWYGAPVAGLNFNTNCVDFTFLPAADGGSAIVQTSPRQGGFAVQGTVKTVTSVKQHKPILGKRPGPVDGRSVYSVGGAVARPAGPFYKPVDDPLTFTGQVVQAELAARGISIDGGVRVERELPGGGFHQIATHRTPLRDVLGRVNTDSQNLMAEALAKLNGLNHQQARGVPGARGSWGTGHLAAVGLLQRLGIDSLSVVCADGSGLSRENRVSARVLAELITAMVRRHPHGAAWVASFARAGETGSLSRRLQDLEGRVMAKTGTINGVSALSGVVIDEHGRAVAFSIIHNGFKGGSAPYRRQQDAIVRAAAEWLVAQPPPPPPPPPPEVAPELDRPEVPGVGHDSQRAVGAD